VRVWLKASINPEFKPYPYHTHTQIGKSQAEMITKYVADRGEASMLYKGFLQFSNNETTQAGCVGSHSYCQ
jgi:hypothetical protein